MKKKVLSLFLCLCLVISLLPAVSVEASAADVWNGTSVSTQLSVVDTSKDYDTSANPLAISSGADLNYLMQQVKVHGNIAYTDSTHAGGSGSTVASSASYRMTVNIVLNDESFTFDSASGIVTVTDGLNTGYLGTGIKGTAYNTATASTAGLWYTSDALTGTLAAGSYSGTLKLWTPIGISSVMCFSGTFDGGIYDSAGNLTGCHTVGGIYINDSSIYCKGLFGYIKGGSVQNTGVINSYIKGGRYTGGVVGENYSGTVSYCYNTGSVSDGSGSSIDDRVGGVVGENYSGTVSYCYNTGAVTGYASVTGQFTITCYVGGVTGSLTGSLSTMQNCYNAGSVSGTNSYVGGVTGSLTDSFSTVQYCYNAGSTSVSGSGSAGGVVGYNHTSMVKYCYYDKQMCMVGGIGGSDLSGSAEGMLTSQMIGNGLKTADTGDGWTGDHWVFTEYLYPRLKDNGGFDMDGTDVALLSALPVTLTGTETVAAVKTDFTLGGITNGVIWTSSNKGVISVSGGNATVVGSGSTVLTSTLGGVSKTVALTVDVPVPVNIITATADGMADTTTSNRIDLTFDTAITGLTADDITITNGTGAVVKGALTGSGITWSIALTSVTTQGNVSVAVAAPAGYSISGSPITVAVYKEESITNAVITPNTGSFDKYIANQTDVQTTVTWNDASSVSDVKTGSTSIGAGSYSVSDINGDTATLTIKKEYLATQSTGSLVLTVEFDKGDAATLTVAVADTTPPSISPVERNFDLKTPADVSTTITWNSAASVTGVVYGAVPSTTPSAYTISLTLGRGKLYSSLTYSVHFYTSGHYIFILRRYFLTFCVIAGEYFPHSPAHTLPRFRPMEII